MAVQVSTLPGAVQQALEATARLALEPANEPAVSGTLPEALKPRPLDKEEQLRLISRSVGVVSDMLGTLSDQHAALSSVSVWLARVARVIGVAVELAVGASWRGHYLRRLVGLAVFVGIGMIPVGVVMQKADVTYTGIGVVAALVGLNLLVCAARDWVYRRRWITLILGQTLLLVVPVVVVAYWNLSPDLAGTLRSLLPDSQVGWVRLAITEVPALLFLLGTALAIRTGASLRRAARWQEPEP